MESIDPPFTERAVPQFSLRSVLIVLGSVGVLLAPYHWFGVVYLVSMGLSVALVLICSLYYRRSAGGAVLVAALGLFFGFFLSFGLMIFGLHSFLSLLLCAVLAGSKRSPKVFAASLATLLIVIYGMAMLAAVAEVHNLTKLNEKYPFESLADRLAFEHQRSAAESNANSAIQLAAAVSTRLDDQENEFEERHYGRPWALRRLHEHLSFEFAQAAGFGAMRMIPLRAERIEIEPRSTLKLPVPFTMTPLNAATSSFTLLHRAAVANFTDPDQLGYIRSRQEVAGFESHGVSALNDDEIFDETPDWQVIRLELVGLLRHDEPCVYVAESMPRMDELADVPSRPLNDFEKSALPQLTSEEDVVIGMQPKRIQMLGALRAGKTCLECHEGQRGKLLGAVSYDLIPLLSKKETPSVRD